ncbi:MAG: aldo/keto reductase [Pirellulaceae bacterium]|jgi:predicted aldo/keto reductase-like oxidoreductase|nr:aldo/keto reductase [Pirellulaceae bacterium]
MMYQHHFARTSPSGAPDRSPPHVTRREFLARSASLAGATLLAPHVLHAATMPAGRTAVDQVPLGNTGLVLSRLGFGTGSHSGNVQKALGQRVFNDLIRYAFDRGITYIDTAQSYATFEWIGNAIKGLPRDKVFLQSKIPGQPEDVLKAIDRHRQVFDTDYIDSMLIHCMVQHGWTDPWKRIMDGFEEAKARQWIRTKGVSCHSLPALRTAVESDWCEVHLVRVNPQAKHVDGPEETWNKSGDDIAPVVEQLQAMQAKGRGVIGMKLVGDGDFVEAEDREQAARFAMAHAEINAVVIGFKSAAEIDEAIDRLDRALAAN